MITSPFKLAFPGMLLTLLMCGFLIFPGAASIMSDPYGSSCIFDGDQVEPALAEPALSSQGQFCFTIDPDNLVMIGDYIKDTYPDIWKMLDPEDQEYYNSQVAVWPCGTDEPMLPNEVTRLLWISQATSGSLFLQENELTSTVPAVTTASGLSSRPAMGNSRFMELRSTVNSGFMPDPGSRTSTGQTSITGLSLQENMLFTASDRPSWFTSGYFRITEMRSDYRTEEVLDSGNFITAWQGPRQVNLGGNTGLP